MLWGLSHYTRTHINRSEKLFVLLVQMGFLQALKALCISSKLDAVREKLSIDSAILE